MNHQEPSTAPATPPEPANEGAVSAPSSRRGFFSQLFMIVSLLISHTLALFYALCFLFPVRRKRTQLLFIGLRSTLPRGRAMPFSTPKGQTIHVLHGAEGFTALSDVCPHLGCRVHWREQEKDFYCPCHAGRFDASGQPTQGPPLAEQTPLSRFPIVEQDDRVYLKVEV